MIRRTARSTLLLLRLCAKSSRGALIQNACFLFLPVVARKRRKRNDPRVCTWEYNGGDGKTTREVCETIKGRRRTSSCLSKRSPERFATDFTKGRKAFYGLGGQRSVFRWRLRGHVTSWTYTRFAGDSLRYRICLAWQTDPTCSGSFIRHSHFRFAPSWEFRSSLRTT